MEKVATGSRRLCGLDNKSRNRVLPFPHSASVAASVITIDRVPQDRDTHTVRREKRAGIVGLEIRLRAERGGGAPGEAHEGPRPALARLQLSRRHPVPRAGRLSQRRRNVQTIDRRRRRDRLRERTAGRHRRRFLGRVRRGDGQGNVVVVLERPNATDMRATFRVRILHFSSPRSSTTPSRVSIPLSELSASPAATTSARISP